MSQYRSPAGSSDGVASPLNLSDTEDFSKDPVANLYCHEQLTDDVMIPTTVPASSTVGINGSTETAPHSFTIPSARFASTTIVGRISRKSAHPIKNRSRTVDSAALLDGSDWRPLRTCCGIVYEHQLYGAVVLDCEQWRREQCAHHGRKAIADVVAYEKAPVIEQTRVLLPATIPSSVASKTALTTKSVPTSSVATIISSAGRKIKLTTNAVQFLKKAGSVRGQAVAAAPMVVPSSANSTNLLGKIITIKTTGAISAIALRSISAVETSTTKFNDNSSDSGYDEAMLQEPNGVSCVWLFCVECGCS